MKRDEIISDPVVHMKLKPKMTVDELIREFGKSGSFGAGRLSTACNIYERMLRDWECTIFLGLAGAMVPAGLRVVIADLIRQRLIDALVATGANMVHDMIEAIGGHHYKGHWLVGDTLLYKHHVYRIYDVFVPEEDFIKADIKIAEMFNEIARESKGRVFATHEIAWEIGKRLNDPNSILRVAYEKKIPIFMPAIRDSEFNVGYFFHLKQSRQGETLKVDSFKEVPAIIDMFKNSKRNGMLILGGGVPRNTIQHAAVTSNKAIDYAVVITMDRAETGGLSGSTLEESVSWGKLKGEADKIMVIGDAVIIFPILVASVLERLGEGFVRRPPST